VRSLQQDLDRAGIPQDRDLELGVMIEVPAAVLVAEGIAREADFLCIGTNDLIQYTLAVDRMNEKVASLYQQFHPAVLRSIRAVLAAAKKHKRVVKLCGEMATDPRAVAVLLGLGVTHFSMNPSSIPTIKQVIRAVRFRDAVQWAHRVTGVSSTEEVERFLSTVVPQWGRSP
jgi:phosphotransferase system enzyme I (PtsI)